jgi:predicted ester cyclase
MSKESDNKAVVGRWFTEFWGKDFNPSVIDELASPDMLLKYSLHEPRRGRADIKAFITDFRVAFPDLNFWGTADLIAEGDYVVGQWEGGGTHTGPAFSDFLTGSLPAGSGSKMRFTGTTVLKVIDGKIIEEVGLDDGLTAMTQLGVVAVVAPKSALNLIARSRCDRGGGHRSTTGIRPRDRIHDARRTVIKLQHRAEARKNSVRASFYLRLSF